MQSQQVNIIDRGRYNKSTYANCAITKISPVTVCVHAYSSVMY